MASNRWISYKFYFNALLCEQWQGNLIFLYFSWLADIYNPGLSPKWYYFLLNDRDFCWLILLARDWSRRAFVWRTWAWVHNKCLTTVYLVFSEITTKFQAYASIFRLDGRILWALFLWCLNIWRTKKCNVYAKVRRSRLSAMVRSLKWDGMTR